MASWNERIIVNKTPNFYKEAVELIDDYFQWKSERDEETEPGTTWEEKHLVDHPENFTISASEIDEMYHDVHEYLSKCKRSAMRLLDSRNELHPYFTIKPAEHTNEMPGFLKTSLVMSDVQSAEEFTRDEFVTCCLFGLDELTDNSQAEGCELGSAEEQALFEKLSNTNFDMKEIFDSVTGTSLSDQEQMMLLRFFQNIDTYYDKVREVLLQVEEVCRRHYSIVRHRYEEKIRKLGADEEKAYYKDWMERVLFHMEGFRQEDPIHMEIGIIAYSSLSIRFLSWDRLKLRLTAGLLFDELNRLKDEGKHRDKMTQRQLKAIADPTRYKIIRQLSIRPHYVQELADILELTAATLSHHLAHLVQVLLVGVSVEGRRSYYTLNAEELTQLSESLNLMAQRSRMEE